MLEYSVTRTIPASEAEVGRLPEGTRVSTVGVTFKKDTLQTRQRAVSEARRIAAAEWANEFGPIPWDFTTEIITHATMAVIAELQVDPEA